MAMDISTYLPGLSLKFFFQLIYTDSVYLEKKNHIKILAQKIELKLSLVGPLSKVCVHPPSPLHPSSKMAAITVCRYFTKNQNWLKFSKKNRSYVGVSGGSRGHDHMVVGFITTCAISAYHH